MASTQEEEELSSLTKLQENLKRGKSLEEEIEKLTEKDNELREGYKWQHNVNKGLHFEAIANNRDRIEKLKKERNEIMGLREEYVRKFINKDVISVSNDDHIEALCHLKKEGWTGKAFIRHTKFIKELCKNDILFNLTLEKKADA